MHDDFRPAPALTGGLFLCRRVENACSQKIVRPLVKYVQNGAIRVDNQALTPL
jgi:hypothetical protein